MLVMEAMGKSLVLPVIFWRIRKTILKKVFTVLYVRA
jgi:hypothetical protein